MNIWSDRWTSVIAPYDFLGWTSVTAQFSLESKEKHILEAWWWTDPKDLKRRETPHPYPGLILAPLFMFFLLPLSLPCVNWASQEGCLLYLRFSLPSSDLPLFYFHELFPSLSFSHHHSGVLFPILTTQQEDPLEKEMATHSSILAWRIPQTEEPGRLQPVGSQRVGHDRGMAHFLYWPSHLGSLQYLQNIEKKNLCFQYLQMSQVCYLYPLRGGIRTLPQGYLIVSCLFLAYLHNAFLSIIESACWNSGKVREAEWILFPIIKKWQLFVSRSPVGS